MPYDYEQERDVLNIPEVCPECGGKLELDQYPEQVLLLCEKCDYQLDITEELDEATKELFGDEEEDEDE